VKTINFPYGLPLGSRSYGTDRTTLFPLTSAPSHRRTRDLLRLREAIPFWFAISSPVIGLIIGLLGAWFVTWVAS